MIKPWFLTEGKLLLCSSYLPLGVPNWSVIYINTGAITLQSVFLVHYQTMKPCAFLVVPAGQTCAPTTRENSLFDPLDVSS
jgi:hypothetical protein